MKYDDDNGTAKGRPPWPYSECCLPSSQDKPGVELARSRGKRRSKPEAGSGGRFALQPRAAVQAGEDPRLRLIAAAPPSAMQSRSNGRPDLRRLHLPRDRRPRPARPGDHHVPGPARRVPATMATPSARSARDDLGNRYTAAAPLSSGRRNGRARPCRSCRSRFCTIH
jgi:hypothetical protein